MSLLTARIGSLVEGVIGIGGRAKEPPGYDLLDLPIVYVRGLPREVVVQQSAEPGVAMSLDRLRSQLVRLCRHVDGMGCGICQDVALVEHAVACSGRVRCHPAR